MRNDLETISEFLTHRQQAQWDLLEQLVNLDSPSDDKARTDRVAAVLAEQVRLLGFEVEFDEQSDHGDNVVARLEPACPPGDRMGGVMLVGHMDTVFGPTTASERPFRRDGGRAFGPGVLDMKGGLVIGLHAVAAALALNETWRTPLTFVFNSDEEPGSPCSREVILREAPRHALALVLEPGTGSEEDVLLTLERKGVGILRIRVDGASAHAGMEPDLGINSIVDAAHRILAVAELGDDRLGTTVNAGVIQGGTHPYVVPETTELSIDVRVESLEEQNRVMDGLRRIVSEVHVRGARATLTGSFHRPPLVSSRESMNIAAQLRSISERIGYPVGIGSTGGASDGNLTSSVGVPTVDGMGAHGGNAHSHLEFIEEVSLPGKTQLLAAFLDGWNAGNHPGSEIDSHIAESR